MGRSYVLIHTGFAGLHAIGAHHWLRPLTQGAGVILTMHHVRPFEPRAFAPNRLLEITPEFLDLTIHTLREQGFDVLALDDALDRLEQRSDSRPFAVLTFDDGYRDNVEHALPVLRRHGVPWTLYACTGCADATARLWWIELEEAIRRLDKVPFWEAGIMRTLPAATDAQKQSAYEAIYWSLRGGSEEALLAATGELAALAGLDLGSLVSSRCLSVSELRALADEPDLTIGAHTRTHPRLAYLKPEAALREMQESRAILQDWFGKPVTHFAYPIGDRTSAGLREFALARDAGFRSAVTTRPGHLFAAHAGHLHALPRVSLNGHFQTREALLALLSGAPFLLWNRGQRLDVT